MAPLAIAPPTYEGPKALGFSKYASPAPRKAHLAVASEEPITTPATEGTTIATKQQIVAAESTGKVAPAASFDATPAAAELAVEQGNDLTKQVEQHTTGFSRVVSSAMMNTRQLLILLRESTPGSEMVDDLWQELERLFEVANDVKSALPEFLEKQRDNMSLYHSSMMNETIRETQQELNLQHKKVNTQHNLILEQQDAFQNYKLQAASKLKELENLQERVSRLTLEKGNFRTEVDKYRELLDQESARKAQDLKAADALQKELEILASSRKQLQDENQTLRKTAIDTLEQLKTTEQRVIERFTKDLQAKAEELQKETIKTTALNTLVNNLKDIESTAKRELDRLRVENRLLGVNYNDQSSEYGVVLTKMNDQSKKIEALTADVDRLQKQNVDLQVKSDKAAKLAEANTALSKAKEALDKQVDSLVAQLNNAQSDTKSTQYAVELLKTKLAAKDAIPVAASSDKALMEKIKSLEEKKDSLEAALAEWTELAKRSYKEYKDMLPTYREAEKHRQEACDKDAQITELNHKLAAARASQSNGVGAAGGDSAYWKQKYEALLCTIG